jgi:hypothetical protein
MPEEQEADWLLGGAAERWLAWVRHSVRQAYDPFGRNTQQLGNRRLVPPAQHDHA